jgi:hypothetical protein
MAKISNRELKAYNRATIFMQLGGRNFTQRIGIGFFTLFILPGGFCARTRALEAGATYPASSHVSGWWGVKKRAPHPLL